MMDKKTIRELVGEIWAEIEMLHLNSTKQTNSEDKLGQFLDISAGVMARHTPFELTNDLDLPVDALPKKDFDSK